MVSDLNILVLKWSKITDFALQNMLEATLPDGLETSGQMAYCLFWHISRSFCVLDDLCRFSINLGFWVSLVNPTQVLVLLSKLVERCFVSRMWDFKITLLINKLWKCKVKYWQKSGFC